MRIRLPRHLKTLAAALVAVLFAAGAAVQPARAEIEVNVNRGDVQPLPIAVPAFGGGQVGADIAQVIAANLQRSGLFRPLDPATFIDDSFYEAANDFDPAEVKAATPGCLVSWVRKTFSTIRAIWSGLISSIACTSMTAMTGLFATFGSRRAIRLALRISGVIFSAPTTLTIGTGQRSPASVFIFSATLIDSATFM